MVYALALVLIAARPAIPWPAAWAMVIGNAAWVLDSAGAVVAGRDSLTALGWPWCWPGGLPWQCSPTCSG